LSERTGLNRQLFWLYEGTGSGPWAFRLGLLAFDAATIAYFLWAPFDTREVAHIWLDYVIGAVIALDLAARFHIARPKGRFFRRIYNWTDAVVVVTMFAPLFIQNLAFLRVLRAVRIIRAFTVLRRAQSLSGYLRQHERITESVTNLGVFIFVMSSLVYVSQVRSNDQIENYLDALYFTVTSLTTTGYGDILMVGASGRLLAILIMILGLSLFVQLLRNVVSPGNKVEYHCESCGLSRHDRDAVHCKHCGAGVHIDTEGFA
jgi:voltage-gated potassium channel